MGRGSLNFMSRIVCLLLLAPRVLGIARTGLRAAPNVAENEGKLAVAGAATVAGELQDTGRLVNSEQKKVSAHLDQKAKNLLPAFLSDDPSFTDYLVASFPELRVINYVRLPDMVWRPLVVSGLLSPKSVVIDEDRNRLYIADTGLCKIVWYQLIPLPDRTLISDGRQHVAVQAVAVRNIGLDMDGNLWFTGHSLPVPPVPSIDGIWKQPLMAIDQGASSGTPIDPVNQWTNAATKSTPSPLVIDAFSIYYGNDMEGSSKGSVAKVPLGSPGGGTSAMADNAETTYSVAVTPTALFYGADNAIYGVQKTKVGGSCGATGDMCKVITDLVKKPTAMLSDGDGSIYVADNGNGAIYSFASGSVSPHALDKVIDAGEVWGLDVYKVVLNKDSSARPRASPLMHATLLVSAVLAAAAF